MWIECCALNSKIKRNRDFIQRNKIIFVDRLKKTFSLDFVPVEYKQVSCETCWRHRKEAAGEVINWGTWPSLFSVSGSAASHE